MNRISDLISGVLIVLLVAIGLFLVIGTPANKDYVQAHAVERWESVGFRVTGYAGHQWGTGIGVYGGARIWYYLEPIKPNGIHYTGYLKRWGDEPLQVYGPAAIDAIKP